MRAPASNFFITLGCPPPRVGYRAIGPSVTLVPDPIVTPLWPATLSSVADLLPRLAGKLPFARRIIWVFTHDNRESLTQFEERPLAASVVFGWAGPQHTERMVALSPELAREPGLYARRFAAGRRCYAAFEGAEPVGWRWTAAGAVDPALDLCAPLRLEPGESYDYDVFVAPRHRGSGLHRALCRSSFQAQLDLGLTTGIGLVLDENLVSLASVSRFSTLVARIERRRWPLRFAWRGVRPATEADASSMEARFAKPSRVRVDPGWLARRGPLLSL
jgi:GNAT superfamily N-acetyltransferase